MEEWSARSAARICNLRDLFKEFCGATVFPFVESEICLL
jgi:hypothetical protein